jgi:hypothetical protein
MQAIRMWILLLTFTLLVGVTNSGNLRAAEDPSGSAKPVLRGVLPPDAVVHGYSLKDLATAWNAWAFDTPESVNPLLAVRCERSSLDVGIWFLPVSLGGEFTNTCYVPHGSFLVLTPGAYECSEAEGHGSTPAELRACVDQGFDLITRLEVTLDGVTATASDLRKYIVTTRFDVLPADNLAGPNANPTRNKGYFMALKLRRGTHTLRAYDEFASLDFKAGITYTIVVR